MVMFNVINLKNNKMKNQLTLLLFFLSCSFMLGQVQTTDAYSYEIGKPYETIKGGAHYLVHNGEMIALKFDWKKFYIQKFDINGLKEISRKEYKNSEILPKNFVMEQLLQVGGKCYYFYSSWSGKKTKKERLYYLTINLDTGAIEDDAVQSVEVDGKLAGSPLGMIPFKSRTSIGRGIKFDLLTSVDSTKILAQYRKRPKVKSDVNSYDIIGFQVFDNAMNAIWSNEFKMPYTERKMDALDYAVDSGGNVYMLVKVYEDDTADDKKKKSDKTANYHIEVFRITQGDSEIQKIELDLEGKFISKLSIFETVGEHMFCAGYYNNGELSKNGFLQGKKFKADIADGIIVFKLNKENGKLVNTVYHEIPVEVLNKYVSDRDQEENKKEDKEEDAAFFANLQLKDVIHFKDGSLVLSGEQYYEIRMERKESAYYVYHYRDILITKINPDGTLAWMDKIPKKQRGLRGKGGMSYTHLTSNGKHYLFFLDNVKNMNLPLNEFPHLHVDGQGGYLTVYAVDDVTGEVTKGSIFDLRNLKGKVEVPALEMSLVIKITEDSFIVEVDTKNKKNALIKVQVNTEYMAN